MENASTYGMNSAQSGDNKIESLTDKIKNIRLTMEGFSAYRTGNFKGNTPLPVELTVGPSGIREFKRKMGNRPLGKPPTGVDLREIVDKVRNRSAGRSPEFSHREIRCFPFILNEFYEDIRNFNFLMSHLDLTRTSQFRRCVYIYFQNYEPGNQESYGQGRLRQSLIEAIHEEESLIHSVYFLSQCPDLLNKNGHTLLGMDLANGIKTVMEEKYKLPMNMRYSRFAKEAICSFFSTVMKMPVWDRPSSDQVQDRFSEVFFNYKDLLDSIAEYVIMIAEEDGNQAFKNDLMKKLDRSLGDPRNPANRKNWNNVSETAISTYISWRTRNDLDLFFKLVDASTGSYSDSSFMWKYRKAFWQSYVDDMKETKILLGDVAEQVARRIAGDQLIAYSKLSAYDARQSVFMFRIGDLIFVDVSHNGSLRIYIKGTEPVPFFERNTYRSTYSYSNDIVHSRITPIATITHSHSENYTWQVKVGRLIASMCGIYKSSSDWRP